VRQWLVDALFELRKSNGRCNGEIWRRTCRRWSPKGCAGWSTEGAHDNSLAPARVVPLAQKWEFAELALRHAEDMLNILVNLATQGAPLRLRLAFP
jgi:hypothetical protein